MKWVDAAGLERFEERNRGGMVSVNSAIALVPARKRIRAGRSAWALGLKCEVLLMLVEKFRGSERKESAEPLVSWRPCALSMFKLPRLSIYAHIVLLPRNHW